MTLITLTAPAVEPVTVAEMRDQVRQDSTAEDALLASYIRAARVRVEGFTRRRLISQEVEFRRDGLGGVIRLPVDPVISLDQITYLDTAGTEQVLSGSLYRMRRSVMPFEVIPTPNAVWPAVLADLDTVGIVLTVGYGPDPEDVPEDFRAAIRGLAAHYYANREAVSPDAGPELPLGVRDLLLPNVLWL